MEEIARDLQKMQLRCISYSGICKKSKKYMFVTDFLSKFLSFHYPIRHSHIRHSRIGIFFILQAYFVI